MTDTPDISAWPKGRVGYIALLGRPNTGKSTFLNALLGYHLSAVSSKPQTTRRRWLGVLSDAESQLRFLDCPGVHLSRNRLDEAMTELARVLDRDPQSATAINNRSVALLTANQPDRAIQQLSAGIAGNSMDAELHYHRGLAYLLQGKLAEGFADYEWRWQTHLYKAPRDRLCYPAWTGDQLQGRLPHRCALRAPLAAAAPARRAAIDPLPGRAAVHAALVQHGAGTP